MKHITYILKLLAASLIALMPIFSYATDFFVEDDSMIKLPKPVEKAIYVAVGNKEMRDSRNPKNGLCKLIGKSVDLGLGANSGYVATTADGCNWGASAGPIWVVLTKPRPIVALSYGGVSLTLENQSQNGLRNILILDGTAGWQSETTFMFDSKHYAKAKEKICDAQEDPSLKCDTSTK